MTVIPAFGRDYRSAAAARADWDANKDFMIADISSRWNGKYVNKEQVKNESVTIRYANLRKAIVIRTNEGVDDE